MRDRPRGREARVQVSLNEWSIAGQGGLSIQPLPSGVATLEVCNDGRASHVLAVWRGGRVVGDEVRGGTLVAETPFVRPGGTETLDVDLEPGEYVLTCPVPGHIEHGMHAQIEVTGPSGVAGGRR